MPISKYKITELSYKVIFIVALVFLAVGLIVLTNDLHNVKGVSYYSLFWVAGTLAISSFIIYNVVLYWYNERQLRNDTRHAGVKQK